MIAQRQTQTSHQLTQSMQCIINTFLGVRDDLVNELQRQAVKLAELQGHKENRSNPARHGTLQALRYQDDKSDEGSPYGDASARAVQVEEEMTLLMIENGVLGSPTSQLFWIAMTMSILLMSRHLKGSTRNQRLAIQVGVTSSTGCSIVTVSIGSMGKRDLGSRHSWNTS